MDSQRILAPAAALALAALVATRADAAPPGSGFPIAIGPTSEIAVDVAFDGTNFLVGVQGDLLDHAAVCAQLVSPSGSLVGPLIETGRTGGAPFLAFGATHYLLAWDDDATSPDNHVFAQLIDPAGMQGPLIPVSLAIGDEEIAGVAAVGAVFLVAYRRDDPGASHPALYARLVESGGTVGAEFQITDSFFAFRGPCVASDGSTFLVAWVDDALREEVYARAVSAAGVPGPVFPVSTSPPRSDHTLTVGSNGTHFLVVWADEAFAPVGGEWDLFGQLVAAPNVLVGGAFPIADSPGAQVFPLIASDGTDFLVSWTDMANDADQDWECDPGEGSCLDIAVRYLDAAGTPLGPEWPVITDSGDQFAGPPAFGAGAWLLVWNDGSWAAEGGDVYGTFLPASGFPTTYCTAKPNSQGCLPAISCTGIPSASDPEPFEVACELVVSNQPGIVFYGHTPQDVPFQGGRLCVLPPIVRTPVQFSGGNPPPLDCSGSYTFDFNAWAQSGIDPGLTPGTTVYAQYWYRDPLSVSFPTGLSDALSFVLQP